MVLEEETGRSLRNPDGLSERPLGAGRLNLVSVIGFLGADIEVRLADIVGRRLAGVQKALAALSLRYPDYSAAVRERQLERARIRFDATEYAQCLREGVTNKEIHQNLRVSLGRRRKLLTKRPPFDLSLDLANMISRVLIFAALDRRSVAVIARRLRAQVALPGEKLVTKREPAMQCTLSRQDALPWCCQESRSAKGWGFLWRDGPIEGHAPHR